VRVLSWVRFDCDELKFMCCNHGHVHDNWMRRGQRVRWRYGTTSCLFMQPRLFVDVDNYHCVHWRHRHVRRVRGWL
jgi:hypothetical protein